MDYYYSTIVSLNFNETQQKVEKALMVEGFGIVSQIDMQEKLKDKLGVSFKKYKILGACNPGFAYQALQAEDKIGTMLPCNVLIIDKEDGRTEVAAINPIASMMAIENQALQPMASEVAAKLKRMIASLNS